MVREAGPDGVELVRNPQFDEWSAAAQPDGFVDRIALRFDPEQADVLGQITSGELDVLAGGLGSLPGNVTAEELAAFEAAHPGQIVFSPTASTLFIGFDVLKPPFDDVRLRQAVNWAIDRAHTAELLGDATTRPPACQILPPGFQGYVPFCPYTLEPNAGTWSAPNQERARSLIEESGAAGMRVTAWVTSQGLPPGAIDVMRYVTGLLDDVGLRATLKVVPDDEQYFGTLYEGAAAGSPEYPHMFLTGWIADYLGASNFITPQFTCGGFGNPNGYCDEELDARIAEAGRLQLGDPGGANRAWSEIEHDLVEDAAIAPLSNPASMYVVSDRIGNAQSNPQWGLLLTRLWVR
jgi:peptide/nickel transport system substrate-binding protein